MVSEITACDTTKAREILVDTNYNIKLSILILNNYSKEKALKLLHQSSGNLHNIL
jgi:N-acetylmuramic acid 6-phosphate (MurNAc-6-P) etherase